MDNIELSRDETETAIVQTTRERIDGTITIYTEDQVWVNKILRLGSAFKDVSDEYGIKRPGYVFRSQNHTATISIRAKRQVSDEQREVLRERLLKARENIGTDKSDV